MKNSIIEFSNVTKEIKDKKVLNDISFSINKNEFHALIGRNGAGKSSIIKTIIFGNKISSGEIKVNSLPYLDASSKKGIGYVPDKLELSPFISVKKFLMRFYLLSGFSRKQAMELMNEELTKHNISHLVNSRFRKLSMGEQKKVILIQSLINKPTLLILDEPTTNLDAFSEQELFAELSEMNKAGVTILIVSHRLDLIEKFSNKITVLNKGEVKFSGNTPKDLLKFLDKKLGGQNE